MDEQPWIDDWPMFEEAHSKLPCLADVKGARIRLARKFNRRFQGTLRSIWHGQSTNDR